MSLRILEIITICSLLFGIGVTVWLIVAMLLREKYTRERFAFIALTSITSLAVTVISSLINRQTPWDSVVVVTKWAFHLPVEQPSPTPTANYILMVVVLAIVSYIVDRIYQNWEGAYSVRQKDLQKYFEPTPLIAEGIFEAKRILTHGKPLEIYKKEEDIVHGNILPHASMGSQIWRFQALELLSLQNKSYEIAPDSDWYDDGQCWIGLNIRTSAHVAILCTQEDVNEDEISHFIRYVNSIDSRSASSKVSTELLIAVRSGTHNETIQFEDQIVHILSEEPLLQKLVDFSDYFASIRKRVERYNLPDSELTLSDVYTVSKCQDEGQNIHKDIESYLSNWLSEKTQRHLALLGEFGQGKSTTTLMFAYHLIQNKSSKRIPILIELRGKSPRNLTPEELIATWAYQFGIDTRAVMKLIQAGKVLLILEGFDEMALAGDSESRISHFQTLWGLCYENSKILITGRPNFFLDDKEMRADLGIQRSDAAGPYCQAIYLKPFTLSQIENALRAMPKKTKSEILDFARKDIKFREIVSRGSLLYVVSQLWERENLSQYAGHITSASVMDLFIKHSLRRQTTKIEHRPNFMVLNESERLYFTTGIASVMGALSLPNQITRDQFEKAVKDLYDKIPSMVSTKHTGIRSAQILPLKERLAQSEDPVEDICNDVRSAGILVFDQSKTGALRFAHKSFMEFLIASVYATHVLREDREYSGALISTSRLNVRHLLRQPVSRIFLAEILIKTVHQNSTNVSGKVAAKSLFDLILAGAFSQSHAVFLQSRVALASLAVSARGIVLMESKSLMRRIIGRQLQVFGQRPSFLFLLVFEALFTSIFFVAKLIERAFLLPHVVRQGGNAVFLHQNIHVLPLSLLLSLLILFFPIAIVYYFAMASQRIIPHIMLWLACCDAAELDIYDVASVAKSSFLVEAYRKSGAYWYTLSDTPFSSTLELLYQKAGSSNTDQFVPSSQVSTAISSSKQ